MATPTAGWYHDPTDSASWRWWDGGTWTGHVRPKDDAPASAPVQIAPEQFAPEQFAPVQTAPVQVAPVQVAPQPTAEPIPQPGVVAPVPQPGRPVSYTPETPPSEQEYWHSPNAEIVEIPGRAATTHTSTFAHAAPTRYGAGLYGSRDWGEVGSPQTPGIWLLASLPLMSIAISVVLGVVFGALQGLTAAAGATDASGAILNASNLLYYGIFLALHWIFAGLDVKALRERGYRPPKIWWMLLLPPLFYFIARGKVVRREGQRAWQPELLYVLSILGLIGLGVAASFFLVAMMGGMAGVVA